MTEFKQIIGRGTRINEEYGKTFFTIMDFRNVTDLFADSNFDGDPVRIKEIAEDDEIESPEDEENNDEPITDEETGEEIIFEIPTIRGGGEIEEPPEPREKIFVNGVNVAILNERIQYMDANGKLITGSLKDYTKQQVQQEFASLDEFLNRWTSSERKQALIDELEDKGIIFDNFREEIGRDMDIFDLICHAAFDKPPLSRKERAENVRKRDYFTKYGDQAKAVLEALLDKYADEGIENIESMKVLTLQPFDQIGSPMEIVSLFGGKQKYLQVITELENELYKVA
jgi:type I restriction enzyme R subunit